MKQLLDHIQRTIPCGYMAEGPPASEPTAWAALALAQAGRSDAAGRAADWLAGQQMSNGAVPASGPKDGPYWTTSLAALVWQFANPSRYSSNIEQASNWLLTSEGTTIVGSPHIGHDTTLVGWSWNPATHSWLEPTAFATMSLQATGHADHPRTREAISLLVDRLLPAGGCNYGNTEILGQTLLPHLQPTGIVMWALAGQAIDDPRIARSLDYIENEIQRPTGCASLAFALLGLSAWGRRPPQADTWIAAALDRPGTQSSSYKLALLALASQDTPLRSMLTNSPVETR